MGRDKLIEEHKAMFENLTSIQEKCTKLILLNRELEKQNELLLQMYNEQVKKSVT